MYEKLVIKCHIAMAFSYKLYPNAYDVFMKIIFIPF